MLERDTLGVAGIVEPGDHTHDSAEKRASDAARDELLASVGYPVMRFDARAVPTRAELRAQFCE